MFILSWNPGEEARVEQEELQESVFSMDQVQIPESSCNTRKDTKTLLRREDRKSLIENIFSFIGQD